MKHDEYISYLNREYGLSLTGMSPLMGNRRAPKNMTRIVAKKFDNGLGRVIYADGQSRLIKESIEQID